MTDSVRSSLKQALDPVERLSEVLSGLIMVLAFTGSFSIATAGPAEVHSLLIGALGCNLASGITDGVFYLIDSLAGKRRGLSALRSARSGASAGEWRRTVASAFPETVMAVLDPADFEAMRQMLVKVPEPPAHPRLDRNDWLGAVSVCLLLVLATFPVVIPFLFIHDGMLALRISHGITVVMMFILGYVHARNVGYRPWEMGLGMVLLGSALAGLTIALGG